MERKSAKQPKDKWEHVTKTSRIEWTVTRKESGEQASFYILEPQFHGHPWTACTAFKEPEGHWIHTYEVTMLSPHQSEALIKALQIASKWSQGRRIPSAAKRG